jgi:hypothetical protein
MAPSAPAKVLCPPGRFTIHTLAAPLNGGELVLGRGDAAITGMCDSVPGKRFMRGIGSWLNVSARWTRCHGPGVTVRARFDFTAQPYCTRLEGVMRVGRHRRVPFIAERIAECGNGIREGDEQCDGADGSFAALDCCDDACHVKDCPLVCDDAFPCPEGSFCARTCGLGGYCVPRGTLVCTATPVCDCDGRTWPNRCAAYEAGVGLAHYGACGP